MVGEHPRQRGRESRASARADLDRRAQRRRLPRRVEELEAEREVEVVEVAAEVRGRHVDLADQQAVAGGLAQRRDRRADVARVARVHVLEASVVAVQRQRRGAGGERVVAQLCVLEQAVERVEAKAVHPARDPEAHDVLHGGDDLGVAPVQVGLLGIEGVQVPAAVQRIARPRRPAEGRDPVVRPLADRRGGCTSRGARGTRGARSRCGRARGPSARAGRGRGRAAMSASSSSSVPKTGSIAVKSETS